MTNGPKECRDVTELTERIIILSAVTHCYLFTSLTEKRRFISRQFSAYLRTDEIFRLSRSEKKSRSLDAFLSRFRSLSLSLPGLGRQLKQINITVWNSESRTEW